MTTLLAWVGRVEAWLAVTWVCLRLWVTRPTPPVPAPAPTRTPKRRRQRVEVDAPFGGRCTVEWGFQGAILERLDEYFTCLRRLRAWDPDGYKQVSRWGVTISESGWLSPMSEKAKASYQDLIAFGGICFPRTEDSDPEMVSPSFLYFTRLRQPSRVERFAGPIYQFVQVMDDREAGSGRYATASHAVVEAHVGVGPDGPVLLREWHTVRQTIRPGRRRKHARRPESIRLACRYMKVPDWVADCANEHDTTPQEYAAWMFGMVFSTYAASTRTGVMVRAKRDGMTAAFCIGDGVAKRFFADRQVEALAADGKKKRIFHAVVSHTRITVKGSTTVKAHYRGLRAFNWNGTAIRIVLPTKNALLRPGFAAVYQSDVPAREREGLLDMGQVVDRLEPELES